MFRLTSQRTNGLRASSGRGSRFTEQDLSLGESLRALLWSAQRIAGRPKVMDKLKISHETICRHIWLDKARGGT